MGHLSARGGVDGGGDAGGGRGVVEGSCSNGERGGVLGGGGDAGGTRGKDCGWYSGIDT